MPFVDPVLENALRQSRQGGLTELTGGHRVYPSCNCCVSGNTVGVYKDPVPILEAIDQDVCAYEQVSVAFGNSFSASSTLQLWSVDWGDGNNSNGAWPPAATVSHPSGQGYILPGNYVIILTITDLLGATASAAVDIYVDDCWIPVGWPVGRPPELADLGSTQVYTTERYGGEGWYTGDITANPPVWTNDLHGLEIERTVVYTESDGTVHLIGYGCGVWEYTPLPVGSPTGAWVQRRSETQLAGDFGYTFGVDCWEVRIGKMCTTINPFHEGWMWAGCYIWWVDGDGDDHVSYGIVYTSDAWSHIQYARVVVDFEDGVGNDDLFCYTERCEIAYDEHGDHLYMLLAKLPEADIFDVPTYDGWWRLYWSQDYGYTWYMSQQETFTFGSPYYPIDPNYMEQALWVPYRNDEYNGGTVYWSLCFLQYTNLAWDFDTVPKIFYSHNFSLSRTDISDVSGNPGCALNVLHGPWNSIHRVYGALVFHDTGDGHTGEIWTFRGDGPAYGWTLFQDVGPTIPVEHCSDLLVMRQNGYALMVCVTAADPERATTSGHYDCQSPEDDCYDFTWVET